MYHQQSPSPGGGGGGQWNGNQPHSSQPQQQWSPQPPNGQYTPRPQQIPPISQAIPQQPAMQTLQPQHPDQYRALPPPQQMYAPPYQPHPGQMPYPPPQPAPRQRTAIACRYCRRRKIRCSGFDQSEDGRCTNCVRFSQECVFTPVHAQTQAFVPAHTVWRGQGPPPNTQLYGAYGQPLPQHGDRNQQQQYPPQQQQQPGQYPPPPQGYQQPQMYQQQPPPQQAGQKRSSDEPHTPTLPPPPPGGQAQMGQNRDPQAFAYPEPVGLTAAGASPVSSNASFNSAQPFYHPSYPYEVPPASSSPQTFVPMINEVHASAIKQQQQAQAAQAALRQEERTSHDTKQGDVTNGAATATPDTAKQEEVYSTKSNMVDAGVQVNLIDTPIKDMES